MNLMMIMLQGGFELLPIWYFIGFPILMIIMVIILFVKDKDKPLPKDWIG